MEPTLLLQLQYDYTFNVVVNVALLQQSLGKTVLVEAFKHVFLVEVSKNLNDFVYSVVQVSFADCLEILFKAFVNIVNKSFSNSVVLVDNLLKGKLKSQINVGVLIHCFSPHFDEAFAHLDEFTDENFIL
jgi:hypothetical protein